MWVWRRRTASGFVFLHLRAIGGCCFAGSRVYCSVVVHSGLSTYCRWARRRKLAKNLSANCAGIYFYNLQEPQGRLVPPRKQGESCLFHLVTRASCLSVEQFG